jgi:protein TonB
MNANDIDVDEEPGFLQRNRIAIGVGIAFTVILGAGIALFVLSGKSSPPRKPPEIMVQLLPPPPPPTPPPPPPPPPKIPPPPKAVEQPPIKPNEPKPKDIAKAPEKAPGPPGPKASGPPSDDGIGGAGGTGGDGSGDGGGSRFGWYGSKIQDAVHQALDQNTTTRRASVRHLKVRIWIDSTGCISRAALVGTSGDAAVDQALKDQALTGLRLSEPPPSDMPMPVVMSIDEERPN